ncbi:MAG: general stress protein [Anaerolineae bacterium]|nr:general stress protein [Anaerolineae bacterium]
MKTVVALYDNLEDARDAVDELVEAGFSRSDISLVARDVTGEYGTYVDEYDDAEEVGEAAAGGAVGGAVVGGLMGLLVGLGAFAIPGLGPVIAAGPVAASLAGAGIGAATGGLLGALVEWGIPEAEAGYYAEGVRRGGTLLSVRVPENRVDDVVDLMNEHDPVNIERRAEYWRSEYDWTGYDPEAEPYGAEEITTYRTSLSDWDEDYDATTGQTRVRSYMGGGTYGSAPTWQDLERTYRDDFDVNYAGGMYTWNEYNPAYRLGYDLATDPTYADRSWEEIEADAETRWGREFEGAWDEFAGAVEYGWEQVKDALGVGEFEAGVEDADDEYAHRR